MTDPQPTTAVQETRTFDERMADKLREQIGDLMTKEELAKLVARGIENVFFVPRKNTSGGWNSEKEPLMNELVRQQVSPLIDQAVKDYLAENKEMIAEKFFGPTFKEGMEMMMLNAFMRLMNQPLYDFKNSLERNFMNGQHIPWPGV